MNRVGLATHKSSIGFKSDRPQQGGGKLLREMAELLDLKLKPKRGKPAGDKKRSADGNAEEGKPKK